MEYRRWLLLRPWQRHSLVLLIGGATYISLGMSFFGIDVTPERARSLVIGLQLFPMDVWASLFIIGGVLALASARWPEFSETWGYMVLCGLAAGWSAQYLLGYFIGGALVQNVTFSIVWALVAFLWWGISGLLNPPPRIGVNDG